MSHFFENHLRLGAGCYCHRTTFEIGRGQRTALGWKVAPRSRDYSETNRNGGRLRREAKGRSSVWGLADRQGRPPSRIGLRVAIRRWAARMPGNGARRRTRRRESLQSAVPWRPSSQSRGKRPSLTPSQGRPPRLTQYCLPVQRSSAMRRDLCGGSWGRRRCGSRACHSRSTSGETATSPLHSRRGLDGRSAGGRPGKPIRSAPSRWEGGNHATS